MSLVSIYEVAASLRHALAACIPDLYRCCRDRWVVIGSAATYLAGETLAVQDLDVLTSTRDAEALIQYWHARLVATDKAADAGRFRSRYACFAFELPVEIMGDLQVHDGRRWQPLQVDDIVTARIDGLEIPVPSIAEQIRILRLFGRDKDLQRATRLLTTGTSP